MVDRPSSAVEAMGLAAPSEPRHSAEPKPTNFTPIGRKEHDV